jgi:ribonuclease VapC
VADVVLDASALLAFLQREPGLDRVRRALPDAVIGSVNFAEVVTKLIQWGAPADEVAERLGDLDLDVHSFDRELAFEAGALHAPTKRLGLLGRPLLPGAGPIPGRARAYHRPRMAGRRSRNRGRAHPLSRTALVPAPAGCPRSRASRYAATDFASSSALAACTRRREAAVGRRRSPPRSDTRRDRAGLDPGLAEADGRIDHGNRQSRTGRRA